MGTYAFILNPFNNTMNKGPVLFVETVARRENNLFAQPQTLAD